MLAPIFYYCFVSPIFSVGVFHIFIIKQVNAFVKYFFSNIFKMVYKPLDKRLKIVYSKGMINTLVDIQIENDMMERGIDMTQFTGKQNILDASLGEFAGFGFHLVEPNDHITELYFKDKRIATYNQTKLTIPRLHEDCRNFLRNTA